MSSPGEKANECNPRAQIIPRGAIAANHVWNAFLYSTVESP